MEMETSSSRRFRVLLFLLIAVLLASREGAVPRAEARVCESLSHNFHGVCLSDRNCAIVCYDEGFTGGHCEGLRRRCFCTKPC